MRIFILVENYFNALSKNVNLKNFRSSLGELLQKNVKNFVIEFLKVN